VARSHSRAPVAAGPATAQVGSEAAAIVAAIARAGGDGAAAAQAQALASRLCQLAEDDARVFAAATAALPDGTPKESDDRRDFALGRALDAAAEVPLAIAESCADVADLARDVSERADPAHAADLEAAALLAGGAARAAAHLVEVNLLVAPDDVRAGRARAAAATQ